MRLDEITDTAPDWNYYMREGCGVFALALAKAFPGGDIYILSDPDGEGWSRSIPFEATHVYYRIGETTADVKGVRSVARMASDFGLDRWHTYGPFAPDTFRRKFVGGADRFPLYGDAADVRSAAALIAAHPDSFPLPVVEPARVAKIAELRQRMAGSLSADRRANLKTWIDYLSDMTDAEYDQQVRSRTRQLIDYLAPDISVTAARAFMGI